MGEFRIFHRGLSNTRWTPSAQEQQIKPITNGSPAGMIPMTLSTALQTLPQELYDIIYGYTFTPNDRHFTIDEFYRPPKALQVSRRTRELFAPSFYGSGSIFYVDTEEYCSRWMASLQSSHIDLLSEIRIMKPRIEMSRGPRQELALQYVMVHLRFDLARDFTVPYGLATQYFRYNVDFEGRQYWVSPAESADGRQWNREISIRTRRRNSMP